MDGWNKEIRGGEVEKSGTEGREGEKNTDKLWQRENDGSRKKGEKENKGVLVGTVRQLGGGGLTRETTECCFPPPQTEWAERGA